MMRCQTKAMTNGQYHRCEEEATYVVIGARQIAARCLEHARVARQLGHNLRTIMPEEREQGFLNLHQWARR